MATGVTIAALALLNVAMPEPLVLDLLGVGLASLGLDLIRQGVMVPTYRRS